MYVEGDVDLDMAITFKTTKKHTEWEHDEHDEHDEQKHKNKNKKTIRKSEQRILFYCTCSKEHIAYP